MPDIPRALELMAWFICMVAGAWGLFVLLACTPIDLPGIAYQAARAAVDGVADRFDIPPAKEAVSPLQGLLGAGGMMAIYLVRKWLFPMGKR